MKVCNMRQVFICIDKVERSVGPSMATDEDSARMHGAPSRQDRLVPRLAAGAYRAVASRLVLGGAARDAEE